MAERVVLVVDDEASQRTVLAGFLRKRGMEVVAAGSVDEAIQVASTRTIDLVLTDLRMPGRDGLTLLDSLRAINPEVPVILMTAFGTVAERGRRDEARRRRLPHQADRSGRARRAGRAHARAAGARLGEPGAARAARVAVPPGRPRDGEREDGRGDQHRGARGGQPRDDPRPRRERHGQGADGARHPLRQPARQGAAGRGERRRAARHADRIGAVRPRARRVHRRRPRATRPLRDGRRRHAVPRRDRRPAESHAGEAAAGAAGTGVRARRRQPDAQDRRPRDRRHQPRSRRDDAHGRVPRGPLLPPQRRLHRAAAAARPARGHPAAGRRVHPPLQRRGAAPRRRRVARGDGPAARSTTTRATCANSRT